MSSPPGKDNNARALNRPKKSFMVGAPPASEAVELKTQPKNCAVSIVIVFIAIMMAFVVVIVIVAALFTPWPPFTPPRAAIRPR